MKTTFASVLSTIKVNASMFMVLCSFMVLPALTSCSSDDEDNEDIINVIDTRVQLTKEIHFNASSNSKSFTFANAHAIVISSEATWCNIYTSNSYNNNVMLDQVETIITIDVLPNNNRQARSTEVKIYDAVSNEEIGMICIKQDKANSPRVHNGYEDDYTIITTDEQPYEPRFRHAEDFIDCSTIK